VAGLGWGWHWGWLQLQEELARDTKASRGGCCLRWLALLPQLPSQTLYSDRRLFKGRASTCDVHSRKWLYYQKTAGQPKICRLLTPSLRVIPTQCTGKKKCIDRSQKEASAQTQHAQVSCRQLYVAPCLRAKASRLKKREKVQICQQDRNGSISRPPRVRQLDGVNLGCMSLRLTGWLGCQQQVEQQPAAINNALPPIAAYSRT